MLCVIPLAKLHAQLWLQAVSRWSHWQIARHLTCSCIRYHLSFPRQAWTAFYGSRREVSTTVTVDSEGIYDVLAKCDAGEIGMGGACLDTDDAFNTRLSTVGRAASLRAAQQCCLPLPRARVDMGQALFCHDFCFPLSASLVMSRRYEHAEPDYIGPA